MGDVLQRRRKMAQAINEGERRQLVSALQDSLASLRAAYQVYQTAHWQAEGPSYYSDHQLFQRLYEETQQLSDALAERIVGLFGAESVDAAEQATAQSREVLASAGTVGVGADHVRDAARRARESLELAYRALEKSGLSAIGLDDLLMSSASKVDEHLYLIGRRVKGRAANPLAVKRRLLRR